MGRWYHDQTGKDGKFWFAVQPSDDPKTIYGMSEVEPDDDWDEEENDGYGESYIDYESSNDEYVKKQLDKQYDILGVPEEERKYECDDENAYVWDDLAKYFLTEQEPQEDATGDKACGYFMGEGEPTMYPISSEKELAASRVVLGLFIYNSIKKDGSCFLTAEL